MAFREFPGFEPNGSFALGMRLQSRRSSAGVNTKRHYDVSADMGQRHSERGICFDGRELSNPLGCA